MSRSVESSTLKKLETIFRKQFLVWTRAQGLEYLDELDLDALLNFRGTWKDGPLAKQKKQSRVIGIYKIMLIAVAVAALCVCAALTRLAGYIITKRAESSRRRKTRRLSTVKAVFSS